MNKIAVTTTCKKSLADIVTPVGIYLRLRDRFRDTILLESADFHAADKSWSFIGVQAIAGFEVMDKTTLEYKFPGQTPEKLTIKSPDEVVSEFNNYLQHFDCNEDCDIKAAQHFFGYTSYDAVQYFDSIEFRKRDKENQFPMLRYRMYQYVIAINHYKDEMYICENHVPGIESELAVLESFIYSKDVPVYPFKMKGEESSNMPDSDYIEMVKKGIASTMRGDVFQIVLSRRFEQGFTGDEFNVYRALRTVNPSPYLFYFDYGDYRLFGSSPESQLIIDNGQAIVHPIAGTFKRTGSAKEDLEWSAALLRDEKENAEHVMLVDLARNDLSRHASNVIVTSYRKVHYYSHVIHLVSEVAGRVNEEAEPYDIMADTFPAGTLSGAPKYKAMQLIDQYEPDSRGYYGGAIGMIGLDGTFNHAIMIRTFFSRHNTLHYQAGAGVVARSNPESELQEVNNKLGALKKAIVIAQDI